MSDLPGQDHQLAAVGGELAESAVDVEAILSAATSVLGHVKPATWVAVVMNPDPDTSRVAAADGGDHAMADYVDAYVAAIDRPNRAPTVGLSQRVIESGNALLDPRMPFAELVAALSPDGRAYVSANPPPHRPDSVGVLIVPMRVGGATIGTLGAFDWSDRGLIGEGDVEWVQQVADRIALSLEHARLTGVAQERTEQMELIRAIALAGRHGQDLRVILRVIVEQLVARLHVDAADILLAAEDGAELVVAASAGFHSPSQPDLRLPASAVPLETPARRPVVQHLADLDLKPRNPRRSHFAREGFQTFAVVPLHVRDHFLGILELYNRSTIEWEEALDFFDTIGSLAAITIDLAALASQPAGRAGAAPLPALSDLELAVLRLIADGSTNREIAERVHRSENTVKFHVRRILEKSGTGNRTELVHRATREGWI